MAVAKKPTPVPPKALPAKATKTGAVTAHKQTAVAAFDASVLEQDADQSKGTFGRDDLAIPFLRVLQDMSPQVKKKDEGYVEGAEPGMLYNTVTKELWDGEKEGLILVVAHYTPSFIEWLPQEKGGGGGKGFVRDHGPVYTGPAPVRDEKNKDMLPNGNELVRSGLYYVFAITDEATGRFEHLAFPLSKTQLKKSRAWNTRMQNIRVPRSNGQGEFTPAPFYSSWKLTTVYESNDKGSWYGVNIEPYKPTLELPFGAGVYTAAKDFKELIAKGAVRTNMEAMAEVVANDDDDERSGNTKAPY